MDNMNKSNDSEKTKNTYDSLIALNNDGNERKKDSIPFRIKFIQELFL